MSNITTQVDRRTTLLLFLFSVTLITIFSTSSPIYPLNPWDDANCFMTIGKSMVRGKRLYHDIFDQKGPILFFLHQIAAYISYRSFLGVWLLEIISYFGFLYYSFRLMRLFTSSNTALPLTLLLGQVILTTDFFFYGDSVEEFSLPILTYTLLHILRYSRDGHIPTMRTSHIIGIGASVLFWMKFTILVFHFGALMALLYIAWKRDQLCDVGRVIALVFMGFFGVSAAVILYFIFHGTLYDLWDAYFYTNLFMYHGSTSNGEPQSIWFVVMKLGIWSILVLPIALMKVNPDVKKTVVAAYGMQMLSFTLFPVHIYYFLVCFSFAPLSIYFLRKSRFTMRHAIIFVVIAIITTAKSFNLVTLVTGNFQTQTLSCAKIVEQGKTNNNDVLTFSSHETGIYQVTDILPPNKYFFASNLSHPTNKAQQAALVATGKVKYLIRKTDPVKTTLEFYQAPIPSFYTLRYQGHQLFRYHFLLNPPMFLWNLGWTQPLLRHFMDGDREEQECILLYERK